MSRVRYMQVIQCCAAYVSYLGSTKKLLCVQHSHSQWELIVTSAWRAVDYTLDQARAAQQWYGAQSNTIRCSRAPERVGTGRADELDRAARVVAGCSKDPIPHSAAARGDDDPLMMKEAFPFYPLTHVTRW